MPLLSDRTVSYTHLDVYKRQAHVDGRVKDILSLIPDAAGDLHAGDEVVHAVERLQEGRLAADVYKRQ